MIYQASTHLAVNCRTGKIAWMGGAAYVPAEVADAIEEKRADPSLYLVQLDGGATKNLSAHIQWIGSRVSIPLAVAAAILEDIGMAIPASAESTAGVGAAFSDPTEESKP